VTPLEDQMYVALMGAQQLARAYVREDTREWQVLDLINAAIKKYQYARSPQKVAPVELPMDWDAVKEISG
jgi:hypothetical protein